MSQKFGPIGLFVFMCDSLLVLFDRVFANGPGDQSSILSLSHIKDSKIVLDVTLLNTELSYLPTPLLGQDMTQGQFFSGV